MVIPSGFAQANFVYSGPAVPTGAEWTLGIDVTAFAGNPTALATSLLAAYGSTNLEALHVANAVLVTVKVKFGPDDLGPSGEVLASLAGTRAGSSTGPQIACLVQKVTDIGGKPGRGRLYFPALAEGDVGEDGTLGVSYKTAATTNWNTFHAKLMTDDTPPMLLHGAGSPVSAPTFIEEFVVSDQVATQRRRNRR